jgi:membrane-associated protease RseP (regulator of RpoE activity)
MAPVTEPATTPSEQDGGERPSAAAWLGLIAIAVGFTWLAFWNWWAFVIAASLVVFVFLHEMGHYMAARATGMKATEFFLGFGPRIWSVRRGETRFGVKAIWAGAYVKVIGMNSLDEIDDPADEPRTYRQASYPRKLLLASAGSLMHFAIAFVLLVTLFAVTGQRDFDAWDESNWRVGRVLAAGPAAAAGIESGDDIVSVDGAPVETFDDLRDAVMPRAGASVPVVIERDGAVIDTVVLVEAAEVDGEVVGRLGVTQEPTNIPLVKENLPEAVWHAATEVPTVIWRAVEAVGSFATNFGDFVTRVFSSPGADDATENPESRPVSLVGVVQVGAEAGDGVGMSAVVELMAVLNIFLGVFNLLPLLPLDGGHIAVATYERIRSTREHRYVVDITKVLPVTYTVFLLLVFLGVGSLWLDITSPITR